MYKLLKSIDRICPLAPISFIDVGARGGIHVPWDQIGSSYLSYFGFEADCEECERFNAKNKMNKNIKYIAAILSDSASTETLYLTEAPGCSSIYEPDTNYMSKFYYGDMWRVKKEILVKTTTLNNIFNSNKIDPDFIKIDCQGAELKILKGANMYLDRLLGVEIETEFAQIYKGQPLFCENNAFLKEKGFELYDLKRYWANRKTLGKYNANRGQLIFADAVYFRSMDSFYFNNSFSDEDKKQKLIKMIVTLALYGFYDIAIEYLRHPGVCLNEKDVRLLEKAILAFSSYPKWQRLLFSNKFANNIGKFSQYMGKLFSLNLKTRGWGADNVAADARYAFYASGKIGKLFRK